MAAESSGQLDGPRARGERTGPPLQQKCRNPVQANQRVYKAASAWLAAQSAVSADATSGYFQMTTTTAPQPNLKLNFNDRDYEFSELPRTAQLLLQDMMRLDQQITQQQFELRHLQAAKHTYGASLRKAMSEEENAEFSAGGSGDGPDGHGGHHN